MSIWDNGAWLEQHDIPQNNLFLESDVNNLLLAVRQGHSHKKESQEHLRLISPETHTGIYALKSMQIRLRCCLDYKIFQEPVGQSPTGS